MAAEKYIVLTKIKLKGYFFKKIEEYDVKSHELLLRKWKKPSTIKEVNWNYDIGEVQKN